MSDAPPDSSGGDPRQDAEQLYVEFLGSDEASLTDGFERLAQRHPELEAELRSLHADFEDLERVLDDAAASPEFPFEELSRLHARGGHKRYRIEGEIARGGQGAVMRIWDSDLKRHLAMKLTLGRVASSTAAGGSPTPASSTPPLDSRTIHRFLNEAKITGQLDHPGIVPIHELGVDDDGQAYFTMKLVNGHSLHEIFHRHRQGDPEWTTQRCVGLILKATEAVAYAHSKGIIHRDLKPANIMVGEYGEVYVMDWGMARSLDSAEREAPLPELDTQGRSEGERMETLEGSVLGTPAYMPPEQARGEIRNLDRRADVYSLGAILYELLSGHAPFRDQLRSQSAVDLLELVANEVETPLERCAPGAHPELVSIAERAMARDAHRRYDSATAALEDLRAHAENRVVAAYEYGVRAELRKWIGRNRALAAAVLVAVLVAALGSAGIFRTQQLRAQENLRADELKRLQADVQAARWVAERIDDPWPSTPGWKASWVEWVSEFDRLCALRPDLEQILEGEGKGPDWRGEPLAGEAPDLDIAALSAREAGLSDYSRAVEQWLGAGPRGQGDVSVLQEQIHGLRLESAAIDGLERRRAVANRLTGLDQNLLTVAARLLGELDFLERPELDLRSWGETAIESIQQASDASMASAEAWNAVVGDVSDFMASPIYRGTRIRPEPLLVPLRKNSRSGLWEFWAPLSGRRPTLSAEGEWLIQPETGVVFVLMPPGQSQLGVQAEDGGSPRFDPWAVSQDMPPTGGITLDPFYLSAFELTQAQWKRMAGSQPSEYYAGYSARGNPRVDWRHPVESVSHEEADWALKRWGMRLPTEAQWEWAALAMGSARFGPYDSDLALALASSREGTEWDELRGIQSRGPTVPSDGYLYHAPVGGTPANPFGLFDMYGNVSEWCADYAPDSLRPGYVKSVNPGDGRLVASASILASYRGSNFLTKRNHIRISGRYRSSPRGARPEIGLRPSMAVLLEQGPQDRSR